MLRLICGYVQQSGRSLDEKQTLYVLNGELDMHSAVGFVNAWMTLIYT